MRDVQVAIDGYILSYSVEGATQYGADEVLLEKDQNLIQDTPWAGTGFVVEPFIGEEDYIRLRSGIRDLLYGYVREFVPGAAETFELESYHKFVTTQETHLAIIQATRAGFPREKFPFDLGIVEKRVSIALGMEVSTVCSFSDELPFNIRIVRPGLKGDNNPPHRDVYLDHLRHAVNIYVPLSASNSLSSLPLVPGSHLWMESEIERTVSGSKVNGVAYRVPAVIGSTRNMAMKRPDPKWNEVLIFSPYMIHGSGVNLNPDSTRTSLEMRFWKIN